MIDDTILKLILGGISALISADVALGVRLQSRVGRLDHKVNRVHHALHGEGEVPGIAHEVRRLREGRHQINNDLTAIRTDIQNATHGIELVQKDVEMVRRIVDARSAAPSPPGSPTRRDADHQERR